MTPELRKQRQLAFTQRGRGRPKGSTRESTLMTRPKRFEFALATALEAVGNIPEARATDLAIMLAAGRPVKVRKSGQRIKFSFEYGGVEERREYLATFSRKVGMDQALTAAEIDWITKSFHWLTRLFTATAANKDYGLYLAMLQGLGWTPLLTNIAKSLRAGKRVVRSIT